MIAALLTALVAFLAHPAPVVDVEPAAVVAPTPVNAAERAPQDVPAPAAPTVVTPGEYAPPNTFINPAPIDVVDVVEQLPEETVGRDVG